MRSVLAAQHLTSLATDHLVEGASELGVVVAEQTPDWGSPNAEIHRGNPRLLRHPRRVRTCRDPGRDDPLVLSWMKNSTHNVCNQMVSP